MNHRAFFLSRSHEKCRPKRRHLFDLSFCLLVSVLALLVCDAATGFAGRLAGGLAFAAAAVFGALAEVTGLKSIDSFHFGSLQFQTIFPENFSTADRISQVFSAPEKRKPAAGNIHCAFFPLIHRICFRTKESRRLSKNVCEAKNNGAAGELEGARPASNGISRRQRA